MRVADHEFMIKKFNLGVAFALVFGLLIVESAKAQDPGFTQFYANPIYLNPALAGSARCPRVVMNYRNQWPALTGTFVTYSASYDQHFDALSGGLGIIATADRAGEGTVNTTNAAVVYSYELPVSNNFAIRAGFQGGYFQKSIDWGKLTFGDMIDPRFGFIYDTREVPGQNTVNGLDFSAGVLGFSRNFYFGFAAHHLTEPNESFFKERSEVSDLPRKYTGHIGAVIPFNKKYPDEGSISPNFLYQTQGTFQQWNIGLYLTKGPLVGGMWYRHNDALAFLLGMQADQVRVGYSYDLTISKLTNATGGSHEISLALQFECRQRPPRFRPLNCPKF